MSYFNPGLWNTMNVAWATNKVLKEDGIPQAERIEKIKTATGLDTMWAKWIQWGKFLGIIIPVFLLIAMFGGRHGFIGNINLIFRKIRRLFR